MKFKSKYYKKTVKPETNKKSKKDTHIKQIAAREAKKVMNRDIETKHVETYRSPIAVYGTSNYYSVHLTPITQGINSNQRIGDVVKPFMLQGKYKLIQSTEAQVPIICRVLVVQFNESSVLPGINEVLFTDTIASPPTLPFELRFRNSDALGTFRVLYDKIHYMDMGYNVATPANKGSSTKQEAYGKFMIKPVFKPVTYINTSTGGLVSDHKKGMIVLYVLSSDSTEVTPVSFTGNFRLSYKDA